MSVGKGGIVRPSVPDRSNRLATLRAAMPSRIPTTGIQSPGVINAGSVSPSPSAFAPAWAGSQYRGVPNRGVTIGNNTMFYNPRNRHGVV